MLQAQRNVTALLPGLAGHRRGTALGIEVITKHEPRTVVADLGEQGRGTDATLAEQRRDDSPVGVCVDGSAERRDLRDQRLHDGDERTYALALGLGLELAGGAAEGVV